VSNEEGLTTQQMLNKYIRDDSFQM